MYALADAFTLVITSLIIALFGSFLLEEISQILQSYCHNISNIITFTTYTIVSYIYLLYISMRNDSET